MADIAKLGFSVDTSGLVRAERAIESLDRASRGLRGVNLPVNLTGAAEARQAIDSISRTARGLRDISVRVNVDGRQANNELRGVASTAQQSAQQISQSITNVRSQMLGLVGATSVVAAGVNIIQMADEYKNLEAKLKLTTKSQQEFIDVQAKLMAMANANRQSMSATIDLYSGIAPSLQRAGQSQENILKAVDSVNKALVVGGSNAVGSAASILQLTQALGSGVLRGDEFNSIMENGRGIALMLADALGTDVGKLRGLAEQGKLTADIVTAALIEQNDAVSKKFATMPVTVGQAMQVVKNNLLSAVGSADAYMGASAALSDSLIALSKNLGTVANIGGLVAAVYAGRGVSALFSYVAANNAAAAAVQAAAVAEARAVQATAAAQAESASSAWAASVAKSRDAQAAVASTAAQAALTESLLAEALAQRAMADQVFLYGPQRAAIERGIAAARAQHTLAIEAQTVATAELAVAQNAATGASAGATAALSAQRVAAAGVGSAMAGTSVIARGLAGSMALVGGPVGAIMLAFGAAIVYREELMGLVTYSGKAAAAEEHHAAAMTQAKDAAYLYADASEEVRKNLDAQKNAALNAARASIDEAKAAVEAAKTKLSVAQVMSDGGSDAAVLSGFGSTDTEEREVSHAEKMLEIQGKALTALEERYNQFGKTKQELDKAFTETPPVVEAATAAMESNAAATATTSKAASEHDKALQGVIESLTKQRIELENGKLAAEYYTNRLNGLTDAEARAAAGAGQYNAYLAERKRQQQALAGIDGGIKSGYLAKLDDLGLTQTGSVFDAIREKTDLAVAANLRYQESLKGTGAIALKVGEQLSGQFDSAFKAASNATGVEEAFLRAVAMQETGYLKTESARTSAVSPKGALGVMQVLPETGARMGYSVADLRDASKNIMAGATYLADQIKSFGGNKALAAAAYNAGPNRQSLREGRIPNIPETQNYVPRVLGYYEQIKGTVAATNAELAKSVPYWDTLTTSTGKVADSMGVYSGQFDNARVTAGGITGLINTELQIATNGLLKTASDHTAEVTKTGYEYRQMQLAQMELEPQMQAMVLAGESQAAYAEQYNALLRERAAIQDPSAIGGYKRGLSDQTLDKSQVESLTGLKLQNTFDAMSAATARQRQEALMSVDAWRLQQLTLETGLTPAMAQSQLQFEQQATHAQKWREITDDAINGVADGLTNAAMGMETDWSGVINKMIAETIKLNTIQPLLKSFFGIFGIATPFAEGGAFGGNGVQAYANGGAFHNSVLTKPTQFFANGGLAVAGEAGAEAVMPLTRIGGRLGVQAVGAGSANITVQNRIEIINKADANVSTKESSNPDGSMSLQILIEPLESMISDRARRGMGLANTFRTVG